MAPCVAETSAVMILIVEDKEDFVFPEVVQVPALSQCWEMIEYEYILCFLQWIQHDKG